MLDLNSGSGAIYGRGDAPPGDAAETTARVNALVDAALVARNRRQRPRDYLGGSRVGEPCARKLVYEVAHAPKDPGRDFEGGILRVFDAGHQFEALSIRWLREAGFDLRDRGADGEQFGFAAAGCAATPTASSSPGPTSASAGRHSGSTRRSGSGPGPTWSSAGCACRSRSTSRRCSSTWPTSSSRRRSSPR